MKEGLEWARVQREKGREEGNLELGVRVSGSDVLRRGRRGG